MRGAPSSGSRVLTVKSGHGEDDLAVIGDVEDKGSFDF